MSKVTKNYPAEVIVHWPTGPVNCCMSHAKDLLALGKFMGAHVVATKAEEGAVCVNCENEKAKDSHD